MNENAPNINPQEIQPTQTLQQESTTDFDSDQPTHYEKPSEQKPLDTSPENDEDTTESQTTGEKSQLTDAEKKELINSSTSFQELYRALFKIDSIPYSNGNVANVELLIDRIEGFRNGSYPENTITRNFDLRDKVFNLNHGPKLESVKTFQELYLYLYSLSPAREIQGSNQTFNSRDLVNIIQSVEADRRNLAAVTQALGFRDKVEKLLAKERVENNFWSKVRTRANL